MPMTEAEWLACTDPYSILSYVRGKESDRKWRLFSVACCRRIWHLLTDERSRRAVDAFERFTDGCLTEEELLSARSQAEQARIEQHHEGSAGSAFHSACGAVTSIFSDQPATTVRWATRAVFDYNVYASMKVRRHLERQEGRWQASVLRGIFGNPYHPSPPLPTSVLAWNGGTVRRIAEGIYGDRKMPEGTLDAAHLAILADALLDAGCDDDALIQHCRSDGPHVRGCWALDLILEKAG
jgi:hypothetical protein